MLSLPFIVPSSQTTCNTIPHGSIDTSNYLRVFATFYATSCSGGDTVVSVNANTMITLKHSSGPWFPATPTQHDGMFVMLSNRQEFDASEIVASLPIKSDFISQDQKVANAHLMASSPELLSVLMELEQYASDGIAIHPRASIWDAVRDLIKKAINSDSE